MNPNKIMILINGLGGTGKDTFINFCREDIPILNFSTIDPSKQAAKILGWTGSKEEKDREFLIALKFLSKKYNNGPRQHIINELKRLKYYNDRKQIIFVHTREPDEIEEFKKYFVENKMVNHALSLLLERNQNTENICKADRILKIENCEYDYKIIINTLQESKEQANIFINNIIKKYF